MPKGFWGTTIELKQDDASLQNFRMSWNGSIIISSKLDGKECDFMLKPKGFFRSAYVLLDTDGNELLALQPDYSWSKFSYHYKLESSGIYNTAELDHILYLVCIHCVNYYMSMATVAAT